MILVSPLIDLKSKASQKLQQIGLPTVAHEDWKYVADQDFEVIKSVSHAVQDYKPCSLILETEYVVVLGKSGIDQGRSRLPKNGVTVEFGDSEVNQNALSGLTQSDDGMVLKAISEMTGVLRILVNPQISLDQPIHIAFDESFLNEQWIQPVVIIELGEKATASVVVHPIMVAGGVVNGLVVVSVADHAQGEIVALNLEGRSAQFVSMSYRATLAESSQFQFLQASHHAGKVRSDVQVTFTAPHANSVLRAVLVLDDQDAVHLRTHMTHLVGECFGRQLVKSILNGQSVSEFHGGVYVAKGADLTDSSQSNENLLLSDQARAISRPQLQIHADDVKAAHGANVGQLDDRHIFYLMSRGIPRAQAEQFLLQSFILEALDSISMPGVKSALKKRLMISGEIGE